MTNRIEKLQFSRDEFLFFIKDITSVKDVFRKLFNTNSLAQIEILRINDRYNIDLKQIISENRIRLHVGKTGAKSHSPYGTWKCRFCGCVFESKHKLYDHYHKCHSEKLLGRHGKGQVAWNKGKTKDNCDSIKIGSEKLQKKFQSGELRGSFLGKHHSKETKRKMSQFHRNATFRRVCKKTRIYVKQDGSEIKMDSSYEVRLATILDELNIQWDRPEPIEWYDVNGGKHHYFPDFRLLDYDLYLDPKNEYCFKVQSEKIKYVTEHYSNVVFMHKEQISKEFILNLINRDY